MDSRSEPTDVPEESANVPQEPETVPEELAKGPEEFLMEPAEAEGLVNVLVERPPAAGGGRLASLDALRGFDMFWIVGGYWIALGLGKGLDNPWFNRHILPQVRHMEWEGFTAWDLIMPLFLFVVGAAMPFSFGKRLEQGQSKVRLALHVLFRVIILWVFGMIAQGRLLTYDLSQFRLYSNTLQAIAAGYLISSILLLGLRLRGQLIVTAVLLLAYWGLLMLKPLTPEENLAIYIDKLILGPYQDGTTYTWILSSMTFATTVMIGAFAGQLLRSDLGKLRKTLFLFAAGIACVYLGWAWGLIFPIVKHIWTSSMVLYAGGWSLILLGTFYLIIDVLRLRFLGYFFIVIGMNAIAVYMVTQVFDFRGLGDIFVRGLAQWTGEWQDFTRAVAGFVILWLILHYMYRKKTFMKI